jgi:hypothetical protein
MFIGHFDALEPAPTSAGARQNEWTVRCKLMLYVLRITHYALRFISSARVFWSG